MPDQVEKLTVFKIMADSCNLDLDARQWLIQWDTHPERKDWTWETLPSLGSDHDALKIYYASIGEAPPGCISQQSPTPSMLKLYNHPVRASLSPPLNTKRARLMEPAMPDQEMEIDEEQDLQFDDGKSDTSSLTTLDSSNSNRDLTPVFPSTDSSNATSNPTPALPSSKTLSCRRCVAKQLEAKKTKQIKDYVKTIPHLKHTKVEVHWLSKSDVRLKKFQDLEKKNEGHLGGPVNKEEVMGIGIKFVSSGLNLLYDSGSSAFIGIINYRDIMQISKPERKSCLSSMRSLSRILNTNYNLARINGPAIHGRMVGLGLKQSFRGGPFKVDPYAPMTQKQGQYNEIAEKEVQPLSAFIMSRFQNVWKCGYDAQIEMARKLKIPNFVAATLDTAEWNDNPGPNLLTITSNGFCKRHHKDHDSSEWTFGGAWGGASQGKEFVGQPKDVSTTVTGGEFVWAEYGIGAGIPAKDNIFTELAWRGTRDYHGTLACYLSDKFKTANRWAFSIQITKAGGGAITKAVEAGGGVMPREQVYRNVK